MSQLNFYVILCYMIPVLLIHFPLGLILSYFLKIFKLDKASNRINNYLANFWMRSFLLLTRRKLTFLPGEWKPDAKNRFLICNHTNALEVPFMVSLPYLASSKDINLSYLGGDIIQRYKIIPLMMHSRIVEAVIYSDKKPDFRNFKKSVLDVITRRSIFLYPEGLRTFTEEIQPFQTGVIKIAYKFGIDLDIFVISGMMGYSGEEKYKHLRKLKKIHFKFCGTIRSSEYSDFESYLASAENLMKANKRQLEELVKMIE